MRLFHCQHCTQSLFFENTRCERCEHRLGYIPGPGGTLSALEPDQDGSWHALARPGARFRLCDNAGHDLCNWLIPAESEARLCLSCAHNRTVPDPTQRDNLTLWRRIEVAKHRLTYALDRLRLAHPNRVENPQHGLAFDILADPPASGSSVITGHAEGLITLALREADDATRERVRQEMGEPYRTLLGHVRHEVGHWYWERLVRDGGKLDEFRAVFGDEQMDYGEALKAYYETGAPADWQDRFVSAYASAHPWEDFAETWAHYLHIVDTLETAHAFGLSVHPRVDRTGILHAEMDFDPYRARETAMLVEAWLPLTFAVNSLNRSMGLPDLYPFVLAPAVIGKLGFIHGLMPPEIKQEG